MLCFPFYLQNAIIQPPISVPNHPPSHSHLALKLKYPSFSPQLMNFYNLLHFPALPLHTTTPLLHDLGMATEPDDYQTISDNCPGYMVVVSEGIICTRCAGEKRHKSNDCPKAAAAAALATDNVPGTDPDGTDNADSGMESLSDTSSVSSESTARSDGSEMRATTAHQSDQGGNHSQDSHLPRRGFARHDASYTSTQPDRTSPSPPNRRAAWRPSQVHQAFGAAGGQVYSTSTHERGTQSGHGHHTLYGPNSPASAETYSTTRSVTTTSSGRPFNNRNHSSIKKWSDKIKPGSPSHDNSIRQASTYEVIEDRLPSKPFADTTGKFDYSNTTCPSSFGFGRLPSEAMG